MIEYNNCTLRDFIRKSAFIFKNGTLICASSHVDLLYKIDCSGKDYDDTAEDPRELFPEGILVGIVLKHKITKEIVYEIVDTNNDRKLVTEFNKVIGDLYIFDFDINKYKKYIV